MVDRWNAFIDVDKEGTTAFPDMAIVKDGGWVRWEDYERLRGELSLAEEGLANYHQEALRLHEQIAVLQGERDRFKQRCWTLAVLLYPYDAPREAVPGDL